MNTNPVNLAIRFLLEIIMLIVFALWGWNCTVGWFHYLTFWIMPAVAAMLWGVFRIPNDPKPAPVKTPGPIRLVLEFVLFGLAASFLDDLGHQSLSVAFAVIVIIHYAVSYDRTRAMLRNKPYTGFVK